MEPTRFGASTDTPATAAALLRALASRHGLVLSPVSPTAAAAAVCAVESLLTRYQRNSLDSTATLPEAGQVALAAALRLAATGVRSEYVPSAACTDFEAAAALVNRLDAWCTHWSDLDGSAVLTLAGECLVRGIDEHLDGLGELLILVAADWSTGHR